jgi:uncharacterized protein (DUF58 family)
MANAHKYLVPETVSKLSNISIIARTVVEGFITGLHKSPYKGFSVEFAEHREYSPGDDIRHLDWRVYARTDRYHVKQYEEETNLRTYLLLDTSRSMSYSSPGRLSKLEYGCYLAASLAYLVIHQQDSAGLVVFDSEIRNYIAPKSSPTHLKQILIQLDVTRGHGETEIGHSFHDLAEMLRRRGLIVVISDLLDETKSVLQGLIHFRHKRHEVVVFHVLDPFEINFPFEKLTQFVDMETDEKIQIDPRGLRQEYLANFSEFVNTYKKAFAENGIDYQMISTETPFERALASYLTKRALLG